MTYKEEITRAMTMLGERDDTMFIGQSVRFSGHVMFNTLENVPMDKRIELPIFEDTQMGMSIGLALAGYLPISIYPRMDFLIIAMNQLVNHLDKFKEMSNGQFCPKVIIRTMVGAKTPLDPGPQHCQDYSIELEDMLSDVCLFHANTEVTARTAYKAALSVMESVIIVEYGDLYG